jgi:5-(carboxyamino)imidazole ribonucleotide mutase
MPQTTTPATPTAPIQVGVVMGSSSDWDTMQHAVDILKTFGIAHEARVVSAHRMPDDLFAYAESAGPRGLTAIIAGAGGAAHLPGMLAAKTTVPVLGVPVASRHLQGVDSLHSIVQMPKGIPVATFAIGTAGAANAALFAVAMLAGTTPNFSKNCKRSAPHRPRPHAPWWCHRRPERLNVCCSLPQANGLPIARSHCPTLPYP